MKLGSDCEGVLLLLRAKHDHGNQCLFEHSDVVQETRRLFPSPVTALSTMRLAEALDLSKLGVALMGSD